MEKRKNFLPTFIVDILFWLAWIFILMKIPPNSPVIFLLFFFSLFMAIFLTFSLVLANSRWGFLLSVGIVTLLILGLLKMTNFLNLILLVGIIISLELYLKKR